jgi:hypothetical protein
MFERDLLEMVQEFFALCEAPGPLISCAQRERVRMIWCIDTAAWISIDVPCAAEFVVFLDDGVGNAEPTERDAPRDGTDARTNDQNMLLRQGVGGRTLGPPCIASNKAISSRIRGAYFGATSSPRHTRIIFSMRSLPGSVMRASLKDVLPALLMLPAAARRGISRSRC